MTDQASNPDHGDVIALLKVARDVIVRQGWTTRDLDHRGPSYSLWMAIPTALMATWPEEAPPDGIPSDWAIKLQAAALAALEQTLNLVGDIDLMAWESESGRTVEDILSAIDKAVVKAANLDLPSIFVTDQAAAERLRSGLDRYRQARQRWRQAVRTRSGPLYDRWNSLTGAYQAAGHPRRVYRMGLPGRWVYAFKVRTAGTWYHEDATEDDWKTWREWLRQRERLRLMLAAEERGIRPPLSGPPAAATGEPGDQ